VSEFFRYALHHELAHHRRSVSYAAQPLDLPAYRRYGRSWQKYRIARKFLCDAQCRRPTWRSRVDRRYAWIPSV